MLWGQKNWYCGVDSLLTWTQFGCPITWTSPPPPSQSPYQVLHRLLLIYSACSTCEFNERTEIHSRAHRAQLQGYTCIHRATVPSYKDAAWYTGLRMVWSLFGWMKNQFSATVIYCWDIFFNTQESNLGSSCFTLDIARNNWKIFVMATLFLQKARVMVTSMDDCINSVSNFLMTI